MPQPMKWIAKLPDGREFNALGGNPEEAAKTVDYLLPAPTKPGQEAKIMVRRNRGNMPPPIWHTVTLKSECSWTAFPRNGD